MGLADTYVTIRPDTTGFKQEADAELRAALANAGVQIKVSADTASADRAADALKAKLADLSRRVTANIDVSDKPAQAKLLALQAQLVDIGKRVIDPKIDLTGVVKAQAAIAALDVDLDRIAEKQVEPQVTVKVDQSRLEQLRAQLAAIGSRAATAQVDVDDRAATAKLLTIRAKLDDIASRTASPGIDMSGVAHAEADLATLDAQLDTLGSKTVSPRVDADTSSGISKIQAIIALIASIGPAVIPITAELAGGIGGIVGVFAAAGAGAGGMAAVAVPAISAVKKALDAQQAAQQAVKDQTGQSADSQISSANAIKSAQLSLQDAQRNAANQAIQSAEQVKNAERSRDDAVRQQSNDQITSDENVKAAEQSLAQAQQQAVSAQEAVTQARIAAKQALQDLGNSLQDAVLGQRQDVLNLQQAQQALAQVEANPQATQTQREQAQLAVDQAVQGLKEQQLQVSRLSDQKKQADKDGVQGSQQVQSAEQNAAQAKQAVADKQQALGDAQRQATLTAQKDAEAVANAQQSLGDAIRNQGQQQAQAASTITRAQMSLQDAYASAAKSAGGSGSAAQNAAQKAKAAFEALTPSEQILYQGWENFKKSFNDFTKSHESEVLPDVTGALPLITRVFQLIGPAIKPASDAVHDLEQDASKALNSPFWKQFFDWLDSNSGKSIKSLGDAVGGVITGGAGIIEAFSPEIDQVETKLSGLGQKFSHFGQDAAEGKSPAFNEFQDFVNKTGPQVEDTLGHIETLIGDLVKDAAPSAIPSLKLISDLADDIDPILSALGKYLPGAVGDIDNLVKHAKPLVQALADPFTEGVATVIRDVAGGLSDIADDVDKLPASWLHGIGEAVGILVAATALSKLSGLSKLAGYLRNAGNEAKIATPKVLGYDAAQDGMNTGGTGPIGGGRSTGGKLSTSAKIGRGLSYLPDVGTGLIIGNAVGHSSAVQDAARDFDHLRQNAENLPGPLGDVAKGFNDIDGKISDLVGNTDHIAGHGSGGGTVATLLNGKPFNIKVTGQETFGKAMEDSKRLIDGLPPLRTVTIVGKDGASQVIQGVELKGAALDKANYDVKLGAKDAASTIIGNAKKLAEDTGKLTPTVHLGAEDKASLKLHGVNNLADTVGGQKPNVHISATDSASKIIGGVSGGLGSLRDAAIHAKAHLDDLADKPYKIEVDADAKWISAGTKAAADAIKNGAEFAVGKQTGGLIRGPGGPTDDKAGVYALSDFEYVHNAATTKREGVGAMDALNQGTAMIVPRLAAGGLVQVSEHDNLAALNGTAHSWLKQNIDQWTKANIGAVGGGAGGAGGSVKFNASAGVQQWAGVVAQALALLHQPGALVPEVLQLIAHESTGNPNIVNTYDINWQEGHPSVGLAQVIRETFQRYAGPFLTDGPFKYGVSVNPLANVYAGLNYGIHDYGSIENIPGIASLLKGGGYKPYASGGAAPGGSWGVVGEVGPELVHFRGPATVYSNAQSRQMGMAGLPGYASGGDVNPQRISGTTFRTSQGLEQAGDHLLDVILSSLTGGRAQTTISAAVSSIIQSIDADFTGHERSGLVAYTQRVNSQLSTLATDRDKIAAQISNANSVAAEVSQDAQQFGAITNLGGTAGPADIITALTTKRDYIRDYNTNLTDLGKSGLSKNAISQLTAEGISTAGPIVEQLASASKSQISQINALQKQIGVSARSVGTTAVDEQLGGTVAKNFVKGLQAQEHNLEAQMTKLGQTLAHSVGHALHLKGYATGGSPTVGEPVRVGENGPETAVFTAPVRIYPHGQQPAAAGAEDRIAAALARQLGVRTAPLIGKAEFHDNTDVALTLQKVAFLAQAAGLSS